MGRQSAYGSPIREDETPLLQPQEGAGLEARPLTPKKDDSIVQKIDSLLWVKLLLVSGLMLTCSSGIIVANRYILVELLWPYPMTVSTFGTVFSAIAGFVACNLLNLAPPVELTMSQYMTKVLPVGAISAVALWLGNALCLHLTIAFIEMCRSLMPLFVLTSLFIFGMETPTRPAVYAVLITAVGCMVSAYGEIHLTTYGLALLALNFLAEAGRLLIMQALLVGLAWHPLQGLRLISPAIAVFLGVGAYFTELPVMREKDALRTPGEHPLIFFMAAVLGLAVTLLGLVVIKISGATTLKVLAAVRGPIVVILGVMLFSEQVTLIEVLGYLVALVGFVWYNYEKATAPAPPAAVKA